MATLEELQWQQQMVQRKQHLKRTLRVVVRIHDEWLHTWFRRSESSFLPLWLAWLLYHARWQRICELEEELKQLEEQLAASKQHHQS